MFVQQFFVKGLAHSSYLLGGTNTCAIIDPRRDIDIYISSAKEMGMTITHILETHLHADFISGHLDLAKKTGAKIYAPKSGSCRFDHVGLTQGDTLEIEDMLIKVLETPGHTPEHVVYVVTDRARGENPVAVFSGDTLFVGDVGRPDLFPDRAQELAVSLYDSLHEKLFKLPDFCEVFPAHGAGSLCGRAMGAKRTSTIGYEKKYNSALQIKEKEKFTKSLTTNMPPAPDHFSRCNAINAKGPALVESIGELKELTPVMFNKKKENAAVLDIRSYESFGGQHIPGAFNIDFGGNFATFAGWVLPLESDILLVADDAAQAREAVTWLRRVGLDRTTGFLDGGMFAWAKAGLPMNHIPQMSPEELYRSISGKEPLSIVDVRAPREYQEFHIDGAVNIPSPDLRKRYTELNKEIPIALICSTGHRSSLAASILKQKGFNEIYNVGGGMMGYNAAGYAPSCPICVIPHGPMFMGKKI